MPQLLTRALPPMLIVLGLLQSTAGAAPQTLQIRDTIGRAWEQEPIAADLAPAADAVADGPVFAERDGRPLPAQLLRTPQGGLRVLFVIDRLEKDTAATVTVDPAKAGTAPTDLALTEEKDSVVLAGAGMAVRLLNRNVENADGGEFSPLLGIRLPDGTWTGGGAYACTGAKPVGSRTELLERGPVRLAARVTTTFDNGRVHAVTFTLWSGSRAVELDETFDVGPADQYRFKEYANDRDELAWEWWSWYGDRDGTVEAHPNNWVVTLSGSGFAPQHASYFGDMSTDSVKGNTQGRGRSDYALDFARERRLEKYLVGMWQWRPDAVTWYSVSPAAADASPALAVFTHSIRDWRNPNVLPTPTGITLRTGANDMRIWSAQEGRRLAVECPIGLGRRRWGIRVDTRAAMLAPARGCPTTLDAERLQRQFGLDITRRWVTDWEMQNDYPRLFVKPAERAAYYARLKGQGIGSPGNSLDTFLRNQDQAGFDFDWRNIDQQADELLAGYFAGTGAESYPAWMLGYWHGIIVAGGVDNLAGTPFCSPAQARSLKKKLAILTYCLVSPDQWPDKQVNYGWGSMNMPVGRWGGRAVMASALSDHPQAPEWLKDTSRYFRMLLETEYGPDGSHISCPHYIGASSTTFYAWIALANSGLSEDVSRHPVLQRFARFYMQLMKPIDPRWGIRVLLNEGDTRPGSSPLPAILARFLKESNPELAGQLMQLWLDGGRDLSLGMGIPDALIIDPDIPARPLQFASAVFPGFGAFLRHRTPGTPEEAYLAFVGGNFMIDHANTDQLGFAWNEKSVPLTDFKGSLYQPMACTAVSHNTLAWDVRPGGQSDPGKGRPGNWYHDHNQPFVDLGGLTPRLHWQISHDQNTQKIIETRGLVTLATESPEAALLEGQVSVRALSEVPTRQDNYAIAVAAQAWPPSAVLAKPFTWTRRLLYVKAPAAAGMNYLVIRDDLGGFAERTPSFSYWAFADDVALAGNLGRFRGSFGVDTDLVVLQPARFTLHKDSFVNTECEPIVGGLHRQKYQQPFSEKQMLCRIEGQAGQGFLVVLFPYGAQEEKPTVEPWLDGAGAKITWKTETHYVLLDTTEHEIDRDGIRARASVLVVKVRDARNAATVLPAGGELRKAFGLKTLKTKPGMPAASVRVNGKERREDGRRLLPAP